MTELITILMAGVEKIGQQSSATLVIHDKFSLPPIFRGNYTGKRVWEKDIERERERERERNGKIFFEMEIVKIKKRHAMADRLNIGLDI